MIQAGTTNYKAVIGERLHFAKPAVCVGNSYQPALAESGYASLPGSRRGNASRQGGRFGARRHESALTEPGTASLPGSRRGIASRQRDDLGRGGMNRRWQSRGPLRFPAHGEESLRDRGTIWGAAPSPGRGIIPLHPCFASRGWNVLLIKLDKSHFF